MQSFCDNYSLKSLIRQPTCYKNSGKPTCIDLVLANMPRSFQSTCVIETGLSDFHLMTLTVMGKNFKKIKPRIINYRSYNNFSNEYYRKCLFNEFKRETFVNNDRGFEKFRDMSIKLLNKHAPIKIKYKRGNHMPFITKDLSKAIMKSSRLRNNYLKNKTDSKRMLYKTQRNYCVSLLRKSKTNYYANLDAKKVSDNKLFWKVIKPSLSDKSCAKEQINLVEKGEILKTDLETAEVLNTFFGNILKNLEINQCSNFNPVINHVKDPTLRAVLKYKDHPSILAIQNKCKNGRKFAFEEIDLASIEKEIHNLKMNKVSQSSDIPAKIIKENVGIFAKLLWKSINSSIKSSTFPSCLKLADVTPLHKKGKKDKKDNTDL